jgi:hypothetical protein
MENNGIANGKKRFMIERGNGNLFYENLMGQQRKCLCTSIIQPVSQLMESTVK